MMPEQKAPHEILPDGSLRFPIQGISLRREIARKLYPQFYPQDSDPVTQEDQHPIDPIAFPTPDTLELSPTG